MDEELEKALRSAKGNHEAEGVTVEDETIQKMRERFNKRTKKRLDDWKQVNERTDKLIDEINESVKNTYKRENKDDNTR